MNTPSFCPVDEGRSSVVTGVARPMGERNIDVYLLPLLKLTRRNYRAFVNFSPHSAARPPKEVTGCKLGIKSETTTQI